MPRRDSILVVGSLNIDLISQVAHFPSPGETVAGGGLQTLAGGKGANQAVAAARLGGAVRLIGRVGDDHFGTDLISQLNSDGVDTAAVRTTPGAPTGAAIILVDSSGQNCIVVSPGANASLSVDDLRAAEPIIAAAGIVVAQLEIPVATVVELAAICRRMGSFFILDPAPVPTVGLPPELFNVDLLSPNRTEALLLAGHQVTDVVDPEVLAWQLLEKGARAVALKLDQDGSLVATREGLRVIPPFKAKVVDTTAAGDAFTAGLAVMLSAGASLDEAACFANAAGAMACETAGAIASLPTLEAVDARLSREAT